MHKNSIFYNAHHAPAGAFFSFTLGSKGASGGFGCELGGPANQSVYIGIGDKKTGQYNAFPFFSYHESEVATFGITNTDKNSGITITPFSDDAITRDLTPCTDTWRAGNLRFTLCSPVQPLPDPDTCSSIEELRVAFLPAVTGELEIDNSRCTEACVVFIGVTGDGASGMRHIDTENISGIGLGRRFALCSSDKRCTTGVGFTAEEVLRDYSGCKSTFALGNTALLLTTVEPGEKMVLRCVFACYRDGCVTSGIDGKYTYQRYFTSVDAVAAWALAHFDSLRQKADDADVKLSGKHLSPERSFMLSQAVRSYYGSTQCIDTVRGVMWMVNEGEYRMINTLDLAVDHLFFELAFHPWAVRNIAKWYSEQYSFIDTLRLTGDASAGRVHGGRSFTHDMGVANVFAAPGTSAYEKTGVHGCFSYMTHEELVNWMLITTTCILHEKDAAWAQLVLPLLTECFTSLVNRDHPEATLRKGYMQLDSEKVGEGSEITTYDSLDPSLGRARGNAYGALKRWAAFVVLHKVLLGSGQRSTAEACMAEAKRTAAAIVAALPAGGVLPSLLDGTDAGVSLPLIEGLVYPWFAGCREYYTQDSVFAPLVAVLKKHFTTTLASRVCCDASGGWKLSSSSSITWLSKLYLCRFVATEILGIKEDELFVNADKVYASWLTAPDNGYFAWSDQFASGDVVGSRYYPRGVTSILWLFEGGRSW